MRIQEIRNWANVTLATGKRRDDRLDAQAVLALCDIAEAAEKAFTAWECGKPEDLPREFWAMADQFMALASLGEGEGQ